jgi:hypothetical protein
MRRTKTALSPSVDVMESRVLLSMAGAPISEHAFLGVVRDVKAIMSTLARTENTVQASAHLTSLSARIPSGPEALGPSWQSDIDNYRPHSAGSIISTERLILGDLYRYLQDGVDGGNQPASGSGSATSTTPGMGKGTSSTPGQVPGGTATPVPAPSLDSVTIQNTTGLALLVTVHLDVAQPQQPYITETIPAQGSSVVTFDFGTATNAFMTMDVSMADGAQTPPPFNDISLSQPLSGYNGTLFTISLFGPYFNVTPL